MLKEKSTSVVCTIFHACDTHTQSASHELVSWGRGVWVGGSGLALAIALGSVWPTGIGKQAKGFRGHRYYSLIRWKTYPLQLFPRAGF